jgi:hypothetical protein
VKIGIVGGLGNMGNRYSCIIRYIGHEPFLIDLNTNNPHELKECDSFIIATPTEAHFENLKDYSIYNKPILCEKPFTKSMKELDLIGKMNIKNLKMVTQYEYMDGFIDAPDAYKSMDYNNSFYNYYRHGKDGLKWDCIQIIGFAKNEVTIKSDSPIWKCRINGSDLNIADMDSAYIKMIHSWIKNPSGDFNSIFNMHHKVDRFVL